MWGENSGVRVCKISKYRIGDLSVSSASHRAGIDVRERTATAGVAFLTVTSFFLTPGQIQTSLYMASCGPHVSLSRIPSRPSSISPPTYFRSHKRTAQQVCMPLKSVLNVRGQPKYPNAHFTRHYHCSCKSSTFMLGLFVFLTRRALYVHQTAYFRLSVANTLPLL